MAVYGEKIIGSIEKFSLEDRCLNALYFASTLVCFLLFIGDLFQPQGALAYVYTGSLTMVFLFLYLLGKKYPNHNLLVWPYLIIHGSSIVYAWYFFGGLLGSSFIGWIAFIIVIPIITKKGLRKSWLGIAFIALITLLAIQITHPNFVVPFPNEDTQILDIAITAIFMGAGLAYLVSLIIFSYDLQKQKADSLNTLNRKFLSIIAHDLKAPLGTLHQMVELAWKNNDDIKEEDMNEIMHSLYLNSQRSYNLLDNLLKWAISESEGLKPKKEVLVLHELVAENKELMESSAKSKDISIQTHISDNAKVCADKNMLNTIIRNLISNAIKFTPSQGAIKVFSQYETSLNQVKLIVEDNGVGMTKETLDHIFDKQTVVSTLGTNKEGGTGFGLKLCKDFAEKINSKLEVSSLLGKGTTFTLAIPCSVNCKP